MSKCYLCELRKKEIEALKAENADLLEKKRIRDGANIKLMAQVASLKSRLVAERANNIRLQIRAEDCGAPKHNFPDGQARIDRSVNEEVLARRQLQI